MTGLPLVAAPNALAIELLAATAAAAAGLVLGLVDRHLSRSRRTEAKPAAGHAAEPQRILPAA